jgi:hypothetical protein
VLGPAMAAAERLILDEMEWEGGGLIAAAQRQEQSGDSDRPAVSAQTQPRPAGPMRKIRLLGLDMDGTLLNSKVEVSARNAAAVRAAVAQGVLVFIATGKVRPRAESPRRKQRAVSAGSRLPNATLRPCLLVSSTSSLYRSVCLDLDAARGTCELSCTRERNGDRTWLGWSTAPPCSGASRAIRLE